MRHFNGMEFEMGEQLLAKPVRKANLAKFGRDLKRKMSSKSNWIEYTWVGFASCTHGHIVVAPGRGPALRIRTVRARPESERWSLKAVQKIVCIPDNLNPKDPAQTAVQPEGRTKGIDFGAKPGQAIDDNSEDAINMSREFKITEAHLQKYGHAPECLGCKAKFLDMSKRPHS